MAVRQPTRICNLLAHGGSEGYEDQWGGNVVIDVDVHFEPPAPPVHAKPLHSWRLIATALRNPLAAYSAESFGSRSSRVSVLGRTTITLNHPDGVKIYSVGLSTYCNRNTAPTAILKILAALPMRCPFRRGHVFLAGLLNTHRGDAVNPESRTSG